MKSARIFETSERKFRFVIQKISISLSRFQWPNMPKLKLFPHCTEYSPQYWCIPRYWCYPPHVLMLSPYCTEQPPQYWRYPPQYWSHPPLYWATSTVLKLSPYSTDVISPCTEQPPQYWTDVIWDEESIINDMWYSSHGVSWAEPGNCVIDKAQCIEFDF